MFAEYFVGQKKKKKKVDNSGLLQTSIKFATDGKWE